MELEGTVFKKLPAVKGTSARGEWTKQEIIIEQPGDFGRKVCVSFWGDKAQDAAALQEGESISVSINLESREFNGRWYTEARAWKLSRPSQGTQAPPLPTDLPPLDGTGADTYAADTADDLPF